MTKRSKDTAPNKGGRPETPNKAEVFSAICRRISDGELVKDASKAEGVDRMTVWRWLREDEGFRDLYTRAREAAADALADEALEVARGSMPERAASDRLLVDTLKWTAAKRRPREYGDKVDLTSGDKPLAATQVIVIGDRTIEF